jgi:hypothetical protein
MVAEAIGLKVYHVEVLSVNFQEQGFAHVTVIIPA